MMKIFIALKTGVMRSLGSWKGILAVWFITLLLVCMIAFPLKGVFRSGFGESTITERLSEGIDIEVFSDLDQMIGGLKPYVSNGLIILLLVNFVLNAFLTGGLFYGVSVSSGNFSMTGFWRACAKNFFSFLVILLLMSMIILFIMFLILSVPMLFIDMESNQVEKTIVRIILTASAIFIILLPLLILVADYARAWQVTQERNRCFIAIGFGFGKTFRTISSSWPTMLVILIIQGVYWWVILKVLPGWTPATGGGIFLFFTLSQLMIFLKILLKVFRYGSVTSLMEFS